MKIKTGMYEILFYQTVPGMEAEVAKNLDDAGASEIFLALSEFDLVAILYKDELPLTFDHHTDVAQKVRDVQETLAFKWTSSRPEYVPATNFPAAGFTFVKLNKAAVNRRGLEVEQQLIQLLEQRYLEVTRQDQLWFQVYGTLGWSELLILWHGKSYQAIIQAVMEIRGLMLPPEYDLEKQPFIADTHTIPCAPLQQNEYADPFSAASLKQIQGAVRPTIAISTHASAHIPVRKALQNISPALQLRTTLGYYDLYIELQQPDISVSELATLLRTIRQQNPGVLSTQITLRDPNDAPEETDLPTPLVSTTKVQDTEIAEIFAPRLDELIQVEKNQINILWNLAPHLAQMVSSYLAASGSEEMDGLVDDMRPFIETLLGNADRLIASTSFVERDSIYRALEEVPLLYKFGFDQRLTGVHVGLANAARGNTSILPINLHRILDAASTVPTDLFRWLPERFNHFQWTGFTIFGYSSYALRFDEGIINLPLYSVLSPADWWFLNHEVGHELSQQLGLGASPTFKSLGARYVNISKTDPHMERWDEAFVVSLLEEFFAEVYSFATICEADWRFYFHAIWNFFQDYLDGNDEPWKMKEYLLRTTFVLACYMELQEAIRPGERLSDAIRAGHQLGGNIMTPDHDTPGYPPPKLNRNLVYRTLGAYRSVAELIDKQIFAPILESYPRLTAELGLVTAEEIAQLYEFFEIIRSDIVNQVKEVLPKNNSALDSRKEIRPFAKSTNVRFTVAHRQLWRQLIDGEIVTKLDQPFQLVGVLQRAKLMAKQDPSFRQGIRPSIAAILSLWHHYKVGQP